MTPAELAAAYDAETLLAAYLLASGSQRWMVYHDHQGQEHFDTREEAEQYATDLMDDMLTDEGAADGQAQIYLLMGETKEVREDCDPEVWPYGDYLVHGYIVVRP